MEKRVDMMKTGRPIHSEIRNNIAKILSRIGKGYGYQIWKEYMKEYPEVTLRSIYYQLGKGVQLELFNKEKINPFQTIYSIKRS